uniref:LIM zinc-binding domain-containing protein n=1 Tax=Meloidogyne enterolobii TaxID=390850 RepID=A0A6V7UCX3_MELEN|nr:unnamed protein product [Meloidogyne enterolobii]
MTEIDIDRVVVEEDEVPRDKRETCEQCGEVIVDQEIVIAQGKIWHKQHFRCSNDRCDVMLQEDYQIHSDLPYCIKCFIAITRPKCANTQCGQRMFGAMFFAVNKYWHAQCFQCDWCGKPLVGGKHYVVDNLPYDLECHWVKRLAIHKEQQEQED